MEKDPNMENDSTIDQELLDFTLALGKLLKQVQFLKISTNTVTGSDVDLIIRIEADFILFYLKSMEHMKLESKNLLRQVWSSNDEDEVETEMLLYEEYESIFYLIDHIGFSGHKLFTKFLIYHNMTKENLNKIQKIVGKNELASFSDNLSKQIDNPLIKNSEIYNGLEIVLESLGNLKNYLYLIEQSNESKDNK